ncbi:MAG: ArgE/DapE family deacylase [Thermomicrobiales bacterium]
MSDLVRILERLVAIDSVNPALVPGGAGEGEIADFIAGWGRDAGLEVEIVETVPGRPSVVATAKGSGGGRSLMLNAHTDTVGVAGMNVPFEPRIDGNRLHGRGSFDMKSGLAAAMIATAAAQKKGLRGDVILTAVSDEEHASIGTTSIAERWTADAAIITEPTDLTLSIAHKGFTWLELETHGTAAHGSRPDLGVDAIAKMGKILVELERLDENLRAGKPHRLLGTGSIHASLISGGQELSSYPDLCRLDIERRTIPNEDAAIVEKQIQSIISRVSESDPSVRATLRTGLVREPYEIDEDAPIVTLLRKQAAAKLGSAPEIGGETGWMDSAILGAAGIPTVIFGPAGDGAHAIEEWVDLESVETCANVLVAVLEEFCA